MEPPVEHTKRVQEELRAAGATGHGAKFAAGYLPRVIHDTEHIMAAVHGHYGDGKGGLLDFSTGMLIATNLRIIFLDHKTGYTSMDEITYDVVTGVRVAKAGIGTAVSLHTRINDYTIRFANVKGIDKFVRYIEKRRLDTADPTVSAPSLAAPIRPSKEDSGMTADAVAFLRSHDLGVLSTVDRTGNVHGAAIYFRIDSQNFIYMITKSSTQKARDMFTNQQVALTVYDAKTLQTAQIHGAVEVVNNPAERLELIKLFTQPREYDDGVLPPPISTVHEEAYVALRIVPVSTRFTNYAAKLKAEN